jgi:3-phosphoglycerate kinase
LNEFDLAKKMSFLSKGGIAMMELFLRGSLPGIKVLEEKNQEGNNR